MVDFVRKWVSCRQVTEKALSCSPKRTCAAFDQCFQHGLAKYC